MINSKWLVLLLGLLVILLAHGIYSVMGAARAREVLDVASDSIATLIDERVPLEMREDSLRLGEEGSFDDTALAELSMEGLRDLKAADLKAPLAAVIDL